MFGITSREPSRPGSITSVRPAEGNLIPELAAWLDKQGMPHIRGAPCHPMTQGKIERWHLTSRTASCWRTTICLGSKPSSPTTITCATTRASTI